MPARLNRRRYREIVATLKEVVADKKAPQQRRLRAVETLMEVYARHDRTEASKVRRRDAESGKDTEPPEPENAQKSLDGLLARIRAERERGQ